MNTEDMIEISGANRVEVVKAAYDLSKPQGMGLIHYQAGELTNDEASMLITPPDRWGAVVSLDYVKGRSCKFSVLQDAAGRLFICRSWYDHSESQLAELLKRIGIMVPGIHFAAYGLSDMKRVRNCPSSVVE